jgi:hypothetical protein
LREERQIPGKVQLAKLKGGLESGDEFAAKHPPEQLGSNPDGKPV